MEQATAYNPFAKRESHSPPSLLTYKILTIASWFLVHVTDIHFGFNAPAGDASNRSIWGQNRANPTPFSLQPFIVDFYWIIILIAQINYLFTLFSSTPAQQTLAANIGSHFIINNVLQFVFVLLWVHARFVFAEAILILNFVNLSFLYFRHSKTPLPIHIGAVSGPLAWTFVAIFWCGAAMVGASGLAARIVANVFVWSILGYGLFFLGAFRDWSVGLELSILSAALAVHQLGIKAFALQWIFAFVIMSVLFVATLAIVVPGYFGKELSFAREDTTEEEDQERQPLLRDE